MTFKVSFINRKQNKELGNIFSRISSLLVISFMLAACSQSGNDLCLEADDWGQMIQRTVVVEAKNQFTPTGINLVQGKPLSMTISGMVDLCPIRKTFCADAQTCDGVITPAKYGWQDADTFIEVGDKSLGMFIDQGTSYTAIHGAVQNGGRGLYAYILDLPKTSTKAERDAAIANVDGNMWYPTTADGQCTLDADGKCTRFFELFDTKTGVSGYSSNGSPVSGWLYFRYARSPDVRPYTAGTSPVSNSGDLSSRRSPWRGEYKWVDVQCDACRQATILLSCSPLLMVPLFGWIGYGVCVGSWQAGCAAAGNLEFSYGDQKSGNKNCQEHDNGPVGAYPGSGEFPGYWGKRPITQGMSYKDNTDFLDHWVNEYANTNGTHNYNDGAGYKISVSKGCQGTYGRFMQMDVLNNVRYASRDILPKSCTLAELRANPNCQCPDGAYLLSGNPGKCLSSQDNSVLQDYTAQLSHIPCSEQSWCDLNSSGIDILGESTTALPVTFTQRGNFNGSKGVYDGTAPYTGELWFEIVDSANEVSPEHPEGEFYGDNLGNYIVEIKTEKVIAYSEILNVIIRPLKRIIYGYCQAGYNPNPPDPAHPAPKVDEMNEADCRAGVSDVGILNTGSVNVAVNSDASQQQCPDGYEINMNTYQCECRNKSCQYLRNPNCTQDSQSDQCKYNEYLTSSTELKWSPGLTQVMYNKLVSNQMFVSAVQAALTLLVIVYAMLFMLGMIQEPVPHFIKRVIRAAIVIQLISPNSWAFFNEYLFIFFIEGMNWFISILAGGFMGVAPAAGVDPSTISNPFMFADITLSKFLSPQTWLKMFALLFASPIGFIYIILIIVGMLMFIKALLKAAILYVLSMLVISLLLILAPIFIAFLLFDSTKSYFNKWIQTLLNYLFQPVLVFVALAIFNVFVYSALYQLLHFRVCWHNVLYLNFGLFSIPIFSFFEPDVENTSYGLSISGTSGIPVGFFLILIFLLVSNIMWKMVDFMSNLAAHITVADRSASVAAAVNKMANQIQGLAGGVVGAALGSIFNAGNLKAVSRGSITGVLKNTAQTAANKTKAAAANKLNNTIGPNAARGALGMKKSSGYTGKDFEKK